jgi:hypothetical protein
LKAFLRSESLWKPSAFLVLFEPKLEVFEKLRNLLEAFQSFKLASSSKQLSLKVLNSEKASNKLSQASPSSP